ncbi:MAG: hypothetical protein M3319_02215, partial [Actinomycetota bacterium]|nr:hypothetical protein [Actinomycetota bacterium]
MARRWPGGHGLPLGPEIRQLVYVCHRRDPGRIADRSGWGPGGRRSRRPCPRQRGYAGAEAAYSGVITPPDLKGSATGVFDTLSDRLMSALSNLRGKGRLSDADIDAT